MKLNEKGLELQKRGNDMWYKAIALDIEENGEENAEFGWSVVEYHGLISSAEDYAGLMLAAQDTDAIWYVLEGEPEDFSDFDMKYEVYYNGEVNFTLWDILRVLVSCGDLTEDEKNDDYVKYAMQKGSETNG